MRANESTPMELPLPRPGTPPRTRVPRAQRWTMDNGLRVLAVPHTTLPQVAIRLIVPAGAAADPTGLPGTAALVGGLLSEGTRHLSPDELNARLDGLGASLSVQVGHDFAEVDLLLLSETLAESVELLAEVVVHPSFPEPELERARAETLDALEGRADEPANVADDRTGEELFGTDHPYGRLSSGTAEGVERVTRDDLLRFHQRHYRPGGTILVAAGDFDPLRLREHLDRVLGAWSGEAEPTVYPEPVGRPARAGERVVVEWPDAAQGEIRVAGAGLARASDQWITAAVANYLLGGSTITGRLGANLREEKGWTYGVRSGFAAALQPGGWVIETAVDGAVVEQALAEIRRELERFVSEPVPEEELRRAKDSLILSLPRAFETPGRIVARLGAVEAFGLPHDYWERFPDLVEAVTGEDILRVARAHFDPDALVEVVVGPLRAGPGGEPS